MTRNLFSKIILLVVTITFILGTSSACSPKTQQAENIKELNGYIIDAHCYDKKPVPALDSKVCLEMDSCAASGYGIAVLRSDKTYDFYYFDGKFAPNADASQETAADFVNKLTKKDHIYINVKGVLTTKTIKAATGKSYPVFEVSSLTESLEP